MKGGARKGAGRKPGRVATVAFNCKISQTLSDRLKKAKGGQSYPRLLAEMLDAWEAMGDCYIFIVENPGEESGYCSPDTAQRYMQHGARLRDPEKPLIHNRVTHPDWHSHSWMSADEFELAIATYLRTSGFQVNTLRLPAPSEIKKDALATGDAVDACALEYITEYWSILAALRCFEMQGKESRLVFWFDN